jgi:DNA-binding transcriptional regulator of glucitol operon
VLRTVVAVVVDTEGKVIHCYICRGLTIFARFKEEPSYRGAHLAAYHRGVKEKGTPHVEKGLGQIYSRKLEAVT